VTLIKLNNKLISLNGKLLNISISFDADALSFINSAGLIDNTQKIAINNLVVGFKQDGVWNKIKAAYPFVGGSQSSHRFNLKDPRNLSTAFVLTFLGTGWTHNASGVKPNGTSNYATTAIIPATHLTTPQIGYYSTENINTGLAQFDMGSYLHPKYLMLSTHYKTGIHDYARAFNSDDGKVLIGPTSPNASGYLSINKVGTTVTLKRNNVLLDTDTDTETLPAAFNIYLFAVNAAGIANSFTNRNCAFAIICDGLTETDNDNIYTRIQDYQTALGRQV